MALSVRRAVAADLPFVEDLRQREKRALGFLPLAVYEHSVRGYVAAYWRVVRLERLRTRCEHRLRRLCAEDERLQRGAGRETDKRRNEKDLWPG